ncbi:kinesin family member 3 [Cavenderia fasciculata]|uniref:Kinesin family member 3 n=1 Tax=Cavenderia fasciculata TaxID=261658 RepID=F4QDI8_CACFS|nr:kinesin family member 3 [Cavenderia fasciculata]EGG13785.1 kinesin family member 3 [Cavenderia fasciculata]|eukprot:XP_004350493.1 kinesin family member 3 [Cavenderia fasciculata]
MSLISAISNIGGSSAKSFSKSSTSYAVTVNSSATGGQSSNQAARLLHLDICANILGLLGGITIILSRSYQLCFLFVYSTPALLCNLSVCLMMFLDDSGTATISSSSDSSSSITIIMSSIRVVCRFRPQNKNELAQGGTSVIEVSDGQTVTIKGNESNHSFTFDRVYSDRNTQKDVYDDAAKPVIEDIMLGYNGTIFVYGQTSSGKTHTMQGPSIDDPELKGVIPRMINTVFDCITKADENIEFIVKASYIEIYMERIRDLLDPRKDNLKVREEKAKGVWVEGTTEVYIYREDDILEVMRTGSANRAIAETKMNAESSRSHSIFILSIQQKNLKEGSMKNGKLYLVDLAGSEKVSKTGAQGVTFDEAKMINKSLSSLGNVINALTDGKSAHIPYRDSKLTRVLQESLGGNSRTTLIINCSPSSYNENETLSTLRFGNRAKNIKNKAKINQERSAAELKILLLKADKEIESLKGYIKELESVSGVQPRSGTSSSGGENIDEQQQQLKEKCIQLEKLLFQKEEEKKELHEHLESITIQLQDREQELESQSHILSSLRDENMKLGNLSHENDILGAQVSELKLALDKLKYESVEQSLAIEGLNSENTSMKSQMQEKKQREDQRKEKEELSLSSIDRRFDEWTEKEEQLKLLQRTPSKAKPIQSQSIANIASQSSGSPLSPMSISMPGTLASVNNNTDPAIIQENESLKQKIMDLELIIQSLKLDHHHTDHNNVPMDIQDLTLSPSSDSDHQDIPLNESTTSATPSLDEIPSEMMLQAEQLRKLLNENSEQRNQLDSIRNDNKKLSLRLSNIEDETRLRMEEELNLLREQTNQKLLEFGSLKESLLRDLENRCQKVIDLELVLDEFQDRVATLQERLNRATKMNGDNEAAMIQLKLDEMTSFKHQLSVENNKLKNEAQRASKQLALRNEHILSLENTIKESQERLFKLALNYDTVSQELGRYKTSEDGKKSAPNSDQSGARIVRPLRGGGGGVVVSGGLSGHGSGALTGGSDSSTNNGQTPQKGTNINMSSNLYANTSKNTREYPSPMNLSSNNIQTGGNNNNSSTHSSPSSTPGSVSPNHPPKLQSENSSSSFFGGLFRKKTTTSPPPNSISNSTSTSRTNMSASGGGGSTATSPPIPLSLNNSTSSYTLAVPTSPAGSNPPSTNNSPPHTPSSTD